MTYGFFSDCQTDSGTFKFVIGVKTLEGTGNLLMKTRLDSDPVVPHVKFPVLSIGLAPTQFNSLRRRLIEFRRITYQVLENHSKEGPFDLD